MREAALPLPSFFEGVSSRYWFQPPELKSAAGSVENVLERLGAGAL
jgi:hypothetical protein